MNEKHLAILREGVETWNAWRKENADEPPPDLSKANLSKANLSRANLIEANLFKANLTGASLVEVGLDETGPGEVGLEEVGLDEVGPGEVSFGEVGLGEVWGRLVGILLPPSIPGFDSLSKNGEVFLIHCRFLKAGCLRSYAYRCVRISASNRLIELVYPPNSFSNSFLCLSTNCTSSPDPLGLPPFFKERENAARFSSW